ncbi:MAG: hypothetical protein GX129_00230, partial [Clostridiales bacterium]|nr:hypothetical protein [Clostridiales bacterium]
MSKVWECIVDVFIGILIMFVSVSVYFGLRTESVIKSMYEDITDEFVTNVKKNGVLTLDDYEGYMERMGTGNNLFNISFEHRYKIYEPEYRFKTLEEILADQNNAYTGSNDYHYREVITERPPVDDSINSGNLNTETNESILARAVNGPKDPNHVHDESCYGGHKHVGEQSFTHMHTHEPGKCIEFVSATTVRCHCNSCDAIYYVGSYYYWNDNTNRVELGSSDFTGTAICITCRGTSITVDAPLYYYGYSCGYRPFYIYGLPEGAGVREPYWVELEYKLINPQGRPGGTYISGCYTYHQTKTVFHNFSKDDLRNIIPLSVYYGVNKMIYTERFRNYCEIPLYYTVGLSDSTYFYYGEVETHPSKGPCLCYLRYKAYLDENGNLRFKLMNYFATASSDTPMRYGTDNPGFPDNITANQLAAFNESYINNLFYEVFDVNYRSYREYHYGDSVVAHIKCFDTDNPSELYEHLDICPYDHSQGTDRWFKTCVYDEDGTLDCDRIIVSLEPTHKVQTVYVNDPLITTATATYLDGSTATVLCSTEHETSAIVRDKEVTIVYVNTIDDIDYRHTAEITVTVIPRNKVCPKGHIYNLNADGSDPGCPYCKEWVESLRIINPTTSPIVI